MNFWQKNQKELCLLRTENYLRKPQLIKKAKEFY